MDFDGQNIVRTRLNIAPLIDIVFLLLIFFMLSSDFVDQQGIEIVLPKSITAQKNSTREIVITVTENDCIYFNKKLTPLRTLPSVLKQKIENGDEKAIIIKADEKINFGLAVKIIDIAKQANAKGLVISTKDEISTR